MSDVLSPWQSTEATASPLGDRYCVVDPQLAASLQTEHSQVFDVAARQTHGGPEALTRELPNVGHEALAHLDDTGVVRVGTPVGPGDLLVGKVAPRAGMMLSHEDKLLRSIFGEAAATDVVDRSRRVPPGTVGTVSAAGHQLAEGEGVLDSASVTVAWTRPLEVGDVLVDRDGHRAVVAAIRPLTAGGIGWRSGGPVEVAKVAMARDVNHARSIGPYSLVTQRPLRTRSQFGGQTLTSAQLTALLAANCPWTAWEMLTLKADCVAGRTRAYEELVRGKHPGPERPDPGGGDAATGPLTFFVKPSPHRAAGRRAAMIPETVLVAERELAALGVDCVTDDVPVGLRWLTSAQIRERSHGEVTKPETVNYQTAQPEPMGLFCERIFGPVVDYECACKKHRTMADRGLVCDTCGVEVTWSKVRRERVGHIVLAMPLPHPWRLGEVADHLGVSVEAVRDVIAGRADLGPDGTISEATGDWSASAPALQAQLEGTDLLLDVFPVLSPDLRPLVPLDGGRWATSDLNDLYRRLLNRSHRLERLLELDAPPPILRSEYAMLFSAAESLVDNRRADKPVEVEGRPLVSLAEMLAGHLGPDLRTKPCDYSGTAALVVDPELEPGVCRVPLELAVELFKPWAYALLETWGLTATIKGAKRLVEQRHPGALHAVRTVAESWPVLLATDRVLASCRVSVGDGVAIAVGESLATQLDREQVVIHVPLGSRSCAELQALQGSVWAVERSEPQPSGWLTALVAGKRPAEAVRAGVERADPIDDPTVRLALGWWPDEAPEGLEWLEALVAEAQPPPPHAVDDASARLRPVSTLGLPDETVAALAAAGVHRVGDLVDSSALELLKAGIRRRPLNAIRDALDQLGLRLER